MRVTRSLLLLLAVAIAVAGCASHQVAYVQMPAYGIDNTVYGNTAPTYAPAPVASYPQTYNYAAAPAPAYGYAAVPQQTYAAPQAAYAAPQPMYAMAAPGYPAVAQPAYATMAQPAYTLDSGDRLRIVVFGQDGLTNSYVVDASGHIAMPLIGSVVARGATTDQLAAAIADKLRDGYIREPHVAVEVEAYRPFFILGEVTQPGQYPYVANMTAETAVAIAGGFSPRAERKSVVLIRNFNGQQMRMAVPLSYPLRPGDTINVKERWF